MIAVKRMQSLFWIIMVALGGLGAYLVSLKVATERNELMRVRAHIARAQSDIRYLETEFSARANVRQLERWNAEDFYYGAPSVVQYLQGERSLAHLDGIQPNGPEYVAPPVMVAMATKTPDAQPAALESAATPSLTAPIAAELSVVQPARAAIVPIAAAKSAAEKTEKKKAAPVTVAAATVVDKAKPDVKARRAERMAMLEASLLDSSTLGDITARAARESKGSKR
jgi:hypothetical protein